MVRVDVEEGFGQRTAGKLRQARVQPLVDRTDRGSREARLRGSSVIAFTPAFVFYPERLA